VFTFVSHISISLRITVYNLGAQESDLSIRHDSDWTESKSSS